MNIRLSFVGANPHPQIEPFERLDTKVSYFFGNDPSLWHSDVPVWSGVRYVDLYPDIDLELGTDHGLRSWRLVAGPGADVRAARLRVEGAETASLDGACLQLTSAAGPICLPLLRRISIFRSISWISRDNADP